MKKISNIRKRRYKNIPNNRYKKELLILVHNIPVSGLTRVSANEYLYNYQKSMDLLDIDINTHTNYIMKHIIRSIDDNCAFDCSPVEVIYPVKYPINDENFIRKYKLFSLFEKENEII